MMAAVLWTPALTLMMASCFSSAFSLSAVPPCRQPCLDTSDNATSYFSVVEEIVGTLKWSKVIIIVEKSAAFDVDPIVRRLHARCISTSVVERSVITTHKNRTSRMLTDDVFEPISVSSGVGCFLVLGSNHFVWHLFDEIAFFFKETAERNWVTPDYASRRLRRRLLMTSEWLTVADVNNLEEWNRLVSPLEHVLILETSNRSTWSVWTSQRSGDSTALRHVITGTSIAALSCVNRHTLLPSLSQGLSGRTLRVVVKEHPLLVSKVKGGGRRRRSFQGYEGAFIDLIDELSKRLNFSYRLQDPPDDSWGQKQEDGHWDGLIGVLTREEADLAVGPFRALISRAEVADYTTPYGFEDTVLLYKTTEASEHDFSSFFIRPLQLPVYAALGVSMLSVLLLMTLGRCCHWYTRGGRIGGAEGRGGGAMVSEMLRWLVTDTESVVAGLLNRSHQSRQPLPRACQVMLVTWLFVSVVVVSCLYSSQLTASLTVRDHSPPFTSLQDLVTQTSYTWGISNGTATQTIVRKTQHSIYSKFYEGVERFSQTDPEVLSPCQDIQLKKVLGGGYAYLSGLGRYMDYWQSLYCHLDGFRVRGLLKPGVFYLQKHSPYTQLFSDTIIRMQAGGLIETMLKNWTPAKKVCQSGGPTPAIRLEQTQTAFYVLGIGAGLALLSVTIEVWWAQINLRKPR